MIWAAAVLAGLAVLLARPGRGGRGRARRLGAALGPARRPAGRADQRSGRAGAVTLPARGGSRDPAGPDARERATARSTLLQLAAVALAGSALAWLVEGVVGLLAGVLAAVGLHRWLSTLESRAARDRSALLAAQLPVAADLLAACLLAGSTVPDALDAVAEAVGDPLGAAVRPVVASWRLGGDPERCWHQLEGEEPLAPLARVLSRAEASGAPVVEGIVRLADEQRATRRWAAEAAVRRLGVRAVAPLGVCFLPAFVLLGVVPVVAGITELVLPGLR